MNWSKLLKYLPFTIQKNERWETDISWRHHYKHILPEGSGTYITEQRQRELFLWGFRDGLSLGSLRRLATKKFMRMLKWL